MSAVEDIRDGLAKADKDGLITEWKENWPAIEFTRTATAESLGGIEQLEVYALLGEHEIFLAGYEDGPIFDAITRTPLGTIEFSDWFNLDEEEACEMEMQFYNLQRDYEYMLVFLTEGYVAQARDALGEWMTREMADKDQEVKV